MPSHFCITIRFLQPFSHGRGDGGESEWPPSPLRVFQSLTAAAAARWNERTRLIHAAPALVWLERQPAPSIVAAIGIASNTKCQFYVPDNTADLLVPAWKKGEMTKQVKRAEKVVRPTHLQGDSVHYLFALPDGNADFAQHRETLIGAARSITHLGWGVDMVAANASVLSDEQVTQLPGERWRPAQHATASYRVPVKGTLQDLMDKHEAFLSRVGQDGFKPVPSLSAFRVQGYRRATEPPLRPFAAFSLLKPDASGFRPFDTARNTMIVAAMMRHAAGAEHFSRVLGWNPQKIAEFILGHGEAHGQQYVAVNGPRMAFIPLPSIEFRGVDRGNTVGSIRRALCTVYGGDAGDDLQQLAQLMSGTNLVAEGASEPVALLSRIPNSDKMVARYTSSARTWATVTPVILPGYDDPRKYRQRLFPKSNTTESVVATPEQHKLLSKLDSRIDYLIRKAIRQAGYSSELSQYAEIEWRGTGFWPGTELATRYAFPNKLRRYRRLHVRINWRDAGGNSIPIRGPICLGGGRFAGLGLFAALDR